MKPKQPSQNLRAQKKDVKQSLLLYLKNASINKKLTIFIMLMIIITVLLTAGTSLLFFLQYNYTVAQQSATNGMNGLKFALDEDKNKALNYASVFTSHPDVIKAIREHNTAAVLSLLSPLVKMAQLDFVTVTDENGVVIARTHAPSKLGDSVINQWNVKMALQGKAVATIEKGTEVKISVRAGVPVKDVTGNVIGVVSAGYLLNNMQLVDTIHKTFKTDATIFFNDIRLSTTIRKNGQRAIGTSLDPRIAKIVLQQKKKYFGQTAILGQPYITAYMPLLGPDGKPLGVLFAGKSLQEVLKTNYIVMISVFLITLVLILLAYGGVNSFLGSTLNTPLKTAVDVLRQVAEGNLNVAIPEKQITQDEIGQLLFSIKVMVGNVRELVHQIHDLGETVASAAEEMMASSAEVSKAGEHVVGAITNLTREASEQASLTEKGNTAIKAVVFGLNQITTDMEDSEHLANKAWEHVNAGHKVVEIQESKMEENKKISNKVSISIHNFAQMSTEIEEILSVIRGVAEQTNLLALNAAIEAARAKEQGRGFAVVAHQVKTLSEQSGESVEKISTIIHNLHSNIGQIVEEMNLVQSTADEEEKALQDLITMFQNMSDSVEIVSARVRTVSKSAGKLADSANHAGTSIDEIAGIAEKTATMADEVSASSEEQTAYMQQISASAENLAKIANELLNKIHRFNV